MNKFTYKRIIIVIVYFVCSYISVSTSIKWGVPFEVSTTSVNVPYNCSYNNKVICCELLEEQFLIDDQTQDPPYFSNPMKCSIHREYIQSPYELLHIQKTLEKKNSNGFDRKKKFLVDFITSQEEVTAANTWLQRVKYHMRTGARSPHPGNTSIDSTLIHPDDLEYLSRFKITKTCRRKCQGKFSGSISLEEKNACRKLPPTITTWYEWIEPLTIHARHPFGVGSCRNSKELEPLFSMRQNFTGIAYILDTDYLLIQSKQALLGYGPSNSRHIDNNDFPYQHQQEELQQPIRTFLFDAGTSIFSSSLVYFTCAYAQRQLAMSSIHAWEVMLLEPSSFWAEVPPEISSRYHYYNIPVSDNITHKDSVLRIIQKHTKVEDFVVLKLDIDTPEVELAIINDIMAYPQLAKLIDELYFELHFQCELLARCWGYHKWMMDHHSGIQMFVKLRKLGIRAHYWV